VSIDTERTKLKQNIIRANKQIMEMYSPDMNTKAPVYTGTLQAKKYRKAIGDGD
jgi:hypothetical protein